MHFALICQCNEGKIVCCQEDNNPESQNVDKLEM